MSVREGTSRSGWCLKLPVTEWNQAEHDGCKMNFMDGLVCPCKCGHKGEKPEDKSARGSIPSTTKRKRVTDDGELEPGTAEAPTNHNARRSGGDA